jgi:hypothetical protein
MTKSRAIAKPKPPARQFSKPQPPADTAENLAQYEKLVEVADREVKVGRKAFYTAARAMEQLRDSRLYLLVYKNWTECCRERWDYSANYVNRMIDDAKTIDAAAKIAAQATNHVPIGTTDLVENEHQARLLKPHLPDLSKRVLLNGQEPRTAVAELLDEAREEQEQRKKNPAMVLESPPSGQDVEQWLVDGLDLLDDPAIATALAQYADLSERVWKRLRPAWFGRRPATRDEWYDQEEA